MQTFKSSGIGAVFQMNCQKLFYNRTFTELLYWKKRSRLLQRKKLLKMKIKKTPSLVSFLFIIVVQLSHLRNMFVCLQLETADTINVVADALQGSLLSGVNKFPETFFFTSLPKKDTMQNWKKKKMLKNNYKYHVI